MYPQTLKNQERMSSSDCLSDCSICLAAIKKETGETKLACGHLFHIGCIGRWILKNDSCPCCRKEMCSEARINEENESDTDSEYSDDDSSESESAIWQAHRRVDADIPKFNSEAHAFWVMRTTFERVEEELSLTPTNYKLPPTSDFRNWHERNHTARDRGTVTEYWPRDDGYESA